MVHWRHVSTVFWEILCHFQICKAKICRTNSSKVTTHYYFFDFMAPVMQLKLFFHSVTISISMVIQRKTKYHIWSFASWITITFWSMFSMCEKSSPILVLCVLKWNGAFWQEFNLKNVWWDNMIKLGFWSWDIMNQSILKLKSLECCFTGSKGS